MRIEEAFLRMNFIKKRWFKKIIFLFVIFFFIIPLIGFFSFFVANKPTLNFSVKKEIEIKKGMSINEIAKYLEKEKIINSALAFKTVFYYYKFRNDWVEDQIPAGHYFFKVPLTTKDVYEKIKSGSKDIQIANVKIKILEGWPNFMIADEVKKAFPKFNKEKFLKLAKPYEGYLYPDTYFFSKYDTDEKIVVEKMHNTFIEKTKELKKEVDKTNQSWEKIIIMASLIEKEAGSAPYSVKRKVSGVLWHRIKIEMPLQVDAVFDYIYQKHISKKLYSHLKIKSPYNTYLNKGLPPGPIANPTLWSIRAALWPEKTSYKYYLTGKDGKFYFSKTYQEHLRKKNKYITNYKEETEEKKE